MSQAADFATAHPRLANLSELAGQAAQIDSTTWRFGDGSTLKAVWHTTLGGSPGSTSGYLLTLPTPKAYQAIREEAKRQGTDKLTMAEIDREVAAVRRPKPSKKSA